MNDELPRIQEQVYYGNIDTHTNVLDKFLSKNGVQCYNPQVWHFDISSDVRSVLVIILVINVG